MYFPKSQLSEPLFTNGGEYKIQQNGVEYKGYYFKVTTGDIYTGRNPQDGIPQLLVPLIPQNNVEVTELNNNPIISLYDYPNNTRFIPLLSQPYPTQDDYNVGYFNRYFCKKSNENKFIEIDEKTYNKLSTQDPEIAWDLYIPQEIKWIISSSIEFNHLKNKETVSRIEINEKWNGFSTYLKNDFSKYSLES